MKLSLCTIVMDVTVLHEASLLLMVIKTFSTIQEYGSFYHIDTVVKHNVYNRDIFITINRLVIILLPFSTNFS